MGETDKNFIIQTLFSQLDDLRQGQNQVMHAVSENNRRVTDLCNTLHAQAIKEKEEDLRRQEQESNWKVQHATAVANCNHKGEIAQEAKLIALNAKKIAEEAKSAALHSGKIPKHNSRVEKIAIGGLITALTTLLGALASWLSNMGHPQ